MNSYLYNEKELLDEDADLGWYDYGFRNYDPQIGRFPQLDPLTFEYSHYTPYQYAGCEPIANVDLDGLEPAGSVIGTLSQPVQLQTVVVRAVRHTGNVASASKALVAGKLVLGALNAAESVAQVKGIRSQVETILSIKGNSGPRVRRVEKSNSEKYWGYQRMVNPVQFSIVNDLWVGVKTLGSGLFDYNKNSVRHLDGTSTTFEERYMAGVAFLSIPLTMGLGSVEVQASRNGAQIAETVGGILKPGGNLIGEVGSNASIREVPGGMEAALSYWRRLVATGAKPVFGTSYKGTLMELPNGGTIGFRTLMTRSPGTSATIDVNIPGVLKGKIKFIP